MGGVDMGGKQDENKLGDGSTYSWQETVSDVYRASPGSLPAKIKKAEKAIIARLSDGELGLNERTAIRDALSIFRILGACTTTPSQQRRKTIA